jgi:hypothetical protein
MFEVPANEIRLDPSFSGVVAACCRFAAIGVTKSPTANTQPTNVREERRSVISILACECGDMPRELPSLGQPSCRGAFHEFRKFFEGSDGEKAGGRGVSPTVGIFPRGKKGLNRDRPFRRDL